MKLSISSNFPGLLETLKKLPNDIQSKVLKPALKQSADAGKTALIRDITQNFNIQRFEVTNSVRSFVSESPKIINGGIGYTATILTSSNKRSLNLIRFIEKKITLAQSRKRNKAGTKNYLHAKIRKTGGYKSLGNKAFVGNKGRTVFFRVDGSRKIKAFQTINISQMANTIEGTQRVIERINEVLENRINNRLKFILSRL